MGEGLPPPQKSEPVQLLPQKNAMFESIQTSICLETFLNLSEGYRAPESSELYRLQRNQSTASLDSESIRGVEIGYKRSWDAGQLNAAIYRYSKKNVIFRDIDFFNVNEKSVDT